LWCSPSTPVSSTNKTYCHAKAEILLIVALNTIILTPQIRWLSCWVKYCEHWTVLLQHVLPYHNNMFDVSLNQYQLLRNIVNSSRGCVNPNTGWLEFRIMRPSGATCLPAKSCFTYLGIQISN